MTSTRVVRRPSTKTYNFAVSNTHTYFVSSGQAGVDAPTIWAHNISKKKKPDRGPKGTKKNPDGTNKEPGQQYEEISEAKDKACKEGKGEKIRSKEKSKQRDKKEIKEQADNWREDEEE